MWDASLGGRLEAIASRFEAWLATKDPSCVPALIALANSSADSFEAFARSWPALFTAAAVTDLAAAAHAALGRDSGAAVGLARLATRLVDRIGIETEDSGAEFVELAGDAWRVYAHALFKAGEMRKAEEAANESEFFFSLEPLRFACKLALLGLTQGLILHELGDSTTGLRIIDRSANLLLAWCDNKKKYVEARIIYAAVLMESERLEEALAVYDDTAALAEEAGDTERLAYILNNVGGCRARLGQFEEANACFGTAIQAFEHLGLRAEVPRVRAAKARSLIRQGRAQEAISELFLARAEFLAAGAPVVAATVSLWIVEQKLALNVATDVRWLCEEMLATFAQADLPREARKALAYLHELAAARAVTPPHVTHVHQFMEHLQEAPGAMFAPM